MSVRSSLSKTITFYYAVADARIDVSDLSLMVTSKFILTPGSVFYNKVSTLPPFSNLTLESFCIISLPSQRSITYKKVVVQDQINKTLEGLRLIPELGS